MAFELPILYQDSSIVVIDKPRGHHVHPPERDGYKVPREKIILYRLRDQIGQKLFPVHRLDVGTSGVLLFALNSETAGRIQKQIQEKRVRKLYWALVRGYFPEEQGKIDLPLELDSTGELAESLTEYRVLKKIEFPQAVGTRHATSRYSWLEVEPRTGRFHQIRRHMNRVSHPVIGDASHGDSRHNRFFRETLGISGLCLRAISLQIFDVENKPLLFTAGPSRQWEKIQGLWSSSPI